MYGLLSCLIDFSFNFVGEIDLLCVLFEFDVLGVFGVVGVVLNLLGDDEWWDEWFLLSKGLIGVNFVCILIFLKDFRGYVVLSIFFLDVWELSF